MDGFFMKNPIKIDHLGGPPLFLETPIYWNIFVQLFLFVAGGEGAKETRKGHFPHFFL